jgi:hypothetical protein
MMSNRIFDVVVWLLIAVFGLVSAYVTFGILSSQASGEVRGYSVEGALAGFIVSAGVLTSLYLQVRKSSGELQELQDRNQELQGKLIRGAPRPPGFDTEVAERERIVLARPGNWKPSGGVIFDYRLPLSELHKDNQSPPQFQLIYEPIEEDSSKSRERSGEPDADLTRYYETLQVQVKEEDRWEWYSCEYVILGGEPQPLKSLKFIAQEYMHIEISDTDPLSGRSQFFTRPLTKAEYESEKNESSSESGQEEPVVRPATATEERSRSWRWLRREEAR